MAVLDLAAKLAQQNQSLILFIALGTLVLFLACSLLFHPLRQIPGPFWSKISSLPLIIQCRKVQKSQWVLQQHQKYGRVVRIAPGHVSVDDPAAINQIYGHKTGFTKGPFYEAFNQVEPVLFNTRNLNIHQRKRKYINPAFSARHLHEFETHINPSVNRIVQAMRDHVSKNKTVDFCRWSNFLAFDVIGEYAFGAPFGFLETGRDDYNLIHTVDTRGEVLNALGHLPLWIRPYMKHFRVDSFWYTGLRSTANLESIGRAAYGRRKNETTPRKDLMSFLINAKDAETGVPLSAQEITAEAISFIVGGSDTTSSTMTNFMDFVSRDQTIQDRIAKELLEAFPGDLATDWAAPEAISGKLPLLNATLKEVMRLRPTSSTGLERVIPEGGKTIAGRFVPPGYLISVPTVAIHHNPEIYHDPYSFQPERWLTNDAATLSDYFIPFSVGPRACVGRNFAWMEMTKTLATLFRLFRFERTTTLPSKTREGFFVKIEECDVKISTRESV